jgi:uncharacterized protein YutD
MNSGRYLYRLRTVTCAYFVIRDVKTRRVLVASRGHFSEKGSVLVASLAV